LAPNSLCAGNYLGAYSLTGTLFDTAIAYGHQRPVDCLKFQPLSTLIWLLWTYSIVALSLYV